MIGLVIREERSSGTAAGSILSIGSRTRFWIMRIRRECNSTVRDGGAHPDGALWGWAGAKAYRKEYERNKHLLLISGDIVL